MTSKDDLDFYTMCLKAHGYTFLQDEVSEDKSESDEESRSMKPPPIPYSKFQHKIVKIVDGDATPSKIHKTNFVPLGRDGDKSNKNSTSIKSPPQFLPSNETIITTTTDGKGLDRRHRSIYENRGRTVSVSRELEAKSKTKSKIMPICNISNLMEEIDLNKNENIHRPVHENRDWLYCTSHASDGHYKEAISKNKSKILPRNTNQLMEEIFKVNDWLENRTLKSNQGLPISTLPNNSFNHSNMETRSQGTIFARNETQIINQNGAINERNHMAMKNELLRPNYYQEGQHESNQQLALAILQERRINELRQIQIANKTKISISSNRNVMSSLREFQHAASDVYKSVDWIFKRFQKKRNYVMKRTKRQHKACVII